MQLSIYITPNGCKRALFKKAIEEDVYTGLIKGFQLLNNKHFLYKLTKLPSLLLWVGYLLLLTHIYI